MAEENKEPEEAETASDAGEAAVEEKAKKIEEAGK